ncbi:MAG: peptidyl-tRNA hydrolase, partial [Spirochaetales bacterium]|nr:peptidyl-tRNA hydrolase [Spirochaetales bacterium]
QTGGGLQGHNGLRNIKERVGGDGFWRLRIGIGRPKNNDVRLYVTTPFTKDESIVLTHVFDKICEKRQEFYKEWEISID